MPSILLVPHSPTQLTGIPFYIKYILVTRHSHSDLPSPMFIGKITISCFNDISHTEISAIVHAHPPK